MNTFVTLLKREYWEHKTGMQWTPIIIGGLIVFAVFLAVFIFSTERVQLATWGSYDITDMFKMYDTSIDAETKAAGTRTGIYFMVGQFLFVLAIVSFFYCLGALYDDRKDKSILFWKSLPVSDTQTVLSKVATVMLVMPLIFWAVMQVTILVVMVLATVFAWFSDVSAWEAIWAPSALPKVSLYQLAAMYMAALWMAPVIGYLLFISSYTKKVPFLMAMVPVILINMTEAIVFNTGYLISWIGNCFAGLFKAFMTPVMQMNDLTIEDELDAPDFIKERLNEDAFSYLYQLTEFDLWAGFVVAAAFIGGAIWIRRYRDEAL